MKTDLLILSFICVMSFASMHRLDAQEINTSGRYELVDSVVYRPAAAVDSTLAGTDIFDHVMSKTVSGKGNVNIDQSPMVEKSVRSHVSANKERTLSGYRVRIFFDNRQTARTESEETLKRFQTLHRDVPAYRTYANPYFKVTVGDFRTKSEAMELLARIRSEFPSAFVVKESISYPIVDKDNAVVVDTVKVVRRKISDI